MKKFWKFLNQNKKYWMTILAINLMYPVLAYYYPEKQLLLTSGYMFGFFGGSLWHLLKFKTMQREYHRRYNQNMEEARQLFIMVDAAHDLYQTTDKSIATDVFAKLYAENPRKLIIETCFYRYPITPYFNIMWDDYWIEYKKQQDGHYLVNLFQLDNIPDSNIKIDKGDYIEQYKMYRGKVYTNESDKIVSSFDDIS